MISTKDKRHNRRIQYVKPIRIAWEENGEPRFAYAKCIEISENGVRIELPYQVRAGSTILLREDSLGLTTSATVKHLIRKGGKCFLGLHLRQGILAKTIALLDGPPENCPV